MPPGVIEQLRERAPNLVGMKVSDAPWDAFRAVPARGARRVRRPRVADRAGTRARCGRAPCRRSRAPSRRRSSRVDPRLHGDPRGDRALPAARRAQAHRCAAGRADPRGRARAAAGADGGGADGARRMARRRIVVAGAGAIGRVDRVPPRAARRATTSSLCDTGEIASGATGKAMGGVRQQFSTAAEVRLAQASIDFFRELGHAVLRPGRLPLPRDDGGRARAACARGPSCSAGSACPSRTSTRRRCAGLRTDDVLGAVICREDGVADPPAAARELVRRAARARGGGARAHRMRASSTRDVLVVACGWQSAELFPELPIRPLVPPARRRRPVDALPETLPMVVEEETTFHFRRRDACLRLAYREPTRALVERRGRRRRARRGRARASRVPLPAGGGRAGRARVGRASTT